MVPSLSWLSFNSKLLKTLTPTVRFVKWKSDAHIVTTDDDSVIVCWHPEKLFPYEKSRSVKDLISESTQLGKSHSVLKIQSSKELFSILKPKKEEIVRKELMAVTHTVKHVWFPPGKRFKRKKPIDMDRPYL